MNTFTPATNYPISPSERLFVPLVAGAVSKLLDTPLHRMRTVMQCGQHGVTRQSLTYGPQLLMEREGFCGLWRGVRLAVVGKVAFEWLNHVFGRLLAPYTNYPMGSPTRSMWIDTVFLGSLPSMATMVAIYPVTHALTLYWNDVASPQGQHHFKDELDVLQSGWMKNGWGGAYRGLGVSLVGLLVFRAVYYGAHPLAISRMGTKAVATGTALVLATLASYPFDVIRARMLVGPSRLSASQTARAILDTEGVFGLFRGVGVASILVLFNVAVKTSSLELYANVRDSISK